MLYGREAQLAQIDALLDAACAQSAGALRLVGGPGLGKTSLLDSAATGATARGMHVVRLVALELEQDLHAAGLDILMRQLGSPTSPSTPGGLLGAVSEASRDRPLLLLIDDVQWLDAQSVAAVSFATRRLMADPVAVILAGRPESDRIASLASLPRLEVPPLADDQGVELLRAIVPDLAGPVAAQVCRALGGVPLALHETVRILPAEVLSGREPLPRAIPVGPAVQERYARGFEALDLPCRRALVLLATAASSDPLVIGEALGRIGQDISVLAPAEDAGLVLLHPVPTFIHPLARAAVHSAAPPGELRQANRVLADALASLGDRHGALRHRAACTSPPDAELCRALEDLALERAAIPASRAEAAEIAVIAARFAPDRPQRHRLQVLAAEFGSRDLALRIAAALESEDLAPDLRARATFVRVDHEGFERPDQVRDELAALEALPLSPENRHLLDDHLLSHAISTLDLAEVRSIAARLELECREGSSWLTLASAGTALMFVGENARAVPLLRRARDASATVDPHALSLDQIIAWATIPGWLAEVDDEHADRFRAMDRVLRARRQPQAVGIAAFFSAERARREGHWDRAAALLEESIGLAAASGMTDVVGLARLACLRAYRGEEASVPGLVESAQDRLDVWSPWSASWLIQAQGALALTRGRPEEAVGILAPVRRYPFVGRGARDAVAACLVDLVESLALTGDRTSAAGAARDLATRLDGIVDPLGLALVARSRALVARDADEADALLAAALREHDRTLEVFERARTLLVRGESLRRTRRPRQAREPLAAALSEFERLRTPDWAQRALRELAASGERVDPRTDGRPVQLTAQEARVALAVAEGLTNTEVAQQLFLSVKTVEFHLSRVYRKLDVRSRGGLARALALHGY